jgi:hypothetical protein
VDLDSRHSNNAWAVADLRHVRLRKQPDVYQRDLAQRVEFVPGGGRSNHLSPAHRRKLPRCKRLQRAVPAMFLLIAILVGFAAGLVSGGRPGNLARLHLRWPGLIFLALVMQVAIFTPWLPIPRSLLPTLYVLSNVIALTWLGRNFRIQGIACFALGAVSNLAAILANGGRMPVDGVLLSRARGAAAAAAIASGQVPSNGVLVNAHTRLLWLTDRFLLPSPFPFPTVFSIGDVLIGLGVAWLIAAGMRPPARGAAAPPNTSLAA